MIENTRYRSSKGKIYIDLKLRQISQLFDSRDPSPFLERDLDNDAVDYIVSASMEHKFKVPIVLVIHLPDTGALTLQPEIIVEAVHNHFEYNAELIRKKLRQTMRTAQLSFAAGTLVLFTCLSLAQGLSGDKAYLGILREGLHILGWVAMWRPIDIFLYSWWPQVEMRKLFLKLAEVPIEFKVQDRPSYYEVPRFF